MHRCGVRECSPIDRWPLTATQVSHTTRVLAEGEADPPNLPTDEGGFEDNLEDDGVYVCAGCGAECYLQDCRFEAGCGWPCFFTCLPDAVRERHDADGTRMELLCNACNGHLGHLFRNEGWELPPPYERHCVNARSLRFIVWEKQADEDAEWDEAAVDLDEIDSID